MIWLHATSYKNIVNVGPVTSEFEGKCSVHPRRSTVWLRLLRRATATDLAEIST